MVLRASKRGQHTLEQSKNSRRGQCTHLYLSFHCETEEDDKIHNKDGPEYRYIKCFKKSTKHGYHDGFRCRVPERNQQNEKIREPVLSVNSDFCWSDPNLYSHLVLGILNKCSLLPW